MEICTIILILKVLRVTVKKGFMQVRRCYYVFVIINIIEMYS